MSADEVAQAFAGFPPRRANIGRAGGPGFGEAWGYKAQKQAWLTVVALAEVQSGKDITPSS
ncbi:MAG: hypothetical protein LAO20_02490 [Acidobacteriia bacterium]|nr:hypothetical protein [Terriglobia bacterium]